MRPRIGFDVDGTLYNFVSQAAKMMGHPDLTPDEGGCATWNTLPETDADGFDALFSNPLLTRSVFEDGEPYEHAVMGVRRVMTFADVYLVTKRPPTARAATHRWLDKHGILPNGLIFIEDFAEKAAIVQSLKMAAYVDDHPDIVEDLGRNTTTVSYLQRRRYNSELKWPRVVNNLLEYAEAVRRLA